jgi:hypothetical protein
MNKVRVKKVLLALTVFLVVIQIFQPRRTNPPHCHPGPYPLMCTSRKTSTLP